MKHYIADELGCVYRLNDGVLEFCPTMQDNTFDDEEFGPVEPDLVGEEEVDFNNTTMTLYEVYEIVTNKLKES